MAARLRLGVIGLGRRWQRCRPTLASLSKEAVVRAVCDPSAARSARVARSLRCAAAGPLDLLERDDVDAVFLADRRWFGLWPLVHACRVGKPIFCAPSLVGDEEYADELAHLVESSRLPVLMDLGTALDTATERLTRLLADRLGQPRVLRAHRTLPPGQTSPALRPASLLALLHGVIALLGEPLAVTTTTVEGTGFVSLVVEFPSGRVAQLNLWPGAKRGGGCRFEVVAERGTARLEPGRCLRWRDADGLHIQRLPRRTAEGGALARFVTALRQGEEPRPTFADAYRALNGLRAARRSLIEGRRIVL